MSSKKFKVLNLSIDRKLFVEGSSVRERFKEYGALFDELHVIVHTPPGFRDEKLAQNVFLYPTNTRLRISYFSKAFDVASKTVGVDRETVVTSQEAFTHRVAIRLKRTFGAKIELQYHTDFMNPNFANESLMNLLRSYAYRRSLVHADTIRVVSERIRRSIAGLVKNVPITVLPIYTDKEKLRNAPVTDDLLKLFPQFDHVFLVASRLEREKNIEMAIEAFAAVSRSYEKAGLVIVGDGTRRAALIKHARDYGVTDKVKFLGWKDNVWSLMKTSQCFVLTSNYEGYALTLVEAALCGVPIVTTDVGVAGDVFVHKRDALVSPIGDITALCDHMLSTMDSPELRKAMIENAKKAADAFIPGKAEYLEHYKKSLEQLLS